MKKLATLFVMAGLAAFQACTGPEGPMGPQGPQGQQGQPGINILSEVFEVTVDFTEADNYEAIFNFTPPIVESDVVLAFIRWETNGQNPVWRALPQTVFFQEGVLMYNYDFTKDDFRLFLDGPLDYTTLGSDWTQDQRFRIVVVPGDYAGNRIDWTNYEAVTKMLRIQEEDFTKVTPTRKN